IDCTPCNKQPLFTNLPRNPVLGNSPDKARSIAFLAPWKGFPQLSYHVEKLLTLRLLEKQSISAAREKHEPDGQPIGVNSGQDLGPQRVGPSRLRRYRACYYTVTWGLHDILSTGGPGLGIRRTNLPRCRARVPLGKLHQQPRTSLAGEVYLGDYPGRARFLGSGSGPNPCSNGDSSDGARTFRLRATSSRILERGFGAGTLDDLPSDPGFRTACVPGHLHGVFLYSRSVPGLAMGRVSQLEIRNVRWRCDRACHRLTPSGHPILTGYSVSRVAQTRPIPELHLSEYASRAGSGSYGTCHLHTHREPDLLAHPRHVRPAERTCH